MDENFFALGGQPGDPAAGLIFTRRVRIRGCGRGRGSGVAVGGGAAVLATAGGGQQGQRNQSEEGRRTGKMLTPEVSKVAMSHIPEHNKWR